VCAGGAEVVCHGAGEQVRGGVHAKHRAGEGHEIWGDRRGDAAA
jgi:hypothetical protein